MKTHKGFTLLELMIVFAIVGILAAVLIPALTGPDSRPSERVNNSRVVLIDRGVSTWVTIEVFCVDGELFVSNSRGGLAPIPDGEDGVKECNRYTGYNEATVAAIMRDSR